MGSRHACFTGDLAARTRRVTCRRCSKRRTRRKVVHSTEALRYGFNRSPLKGSATPPVEGRKRGGKFLSSAGRSRLRDGGRKARWRDKKELEDGLVLGDVSMRVTWLGRASGQNLIGLACWPFAACLGKRCVQNTSRCPFSRRGCRRGRRRGRDGGPPLNPRPLIQRERISLGRSLASWLVSPTASNSLRPFSAASSHFL